MPTQKDTEEKPVYTSVIANIQSAATASPRFMSQIEAIALRSDNGIELLKSVVGYMESLTYLEVGEIMAASAEIVGGDAQQAMLANASAYARVEAYETLSLKLMSIVNRKEGI